LDASRLERPEGKTAIADQRFVDRQLRVALLEQVEL
jgi:hypothetical protein